MAHLAGEPAAILAYGDQKRLELARALATAPRLLLLDEPAAGLNSKEKKDLSAIIHDLADGGITVMLIEHDMRFIMSLCHVLVVIDHGQIIAQGDPASVRGNPRVIAAYLGSGGTGLC
jgi:ABC-type branched-subunit amino acid transport system ATPase component